MKSRLLNQLAAPGAARLTLSVLLQLTVSETALVTLGVLLQLSANTCIWTVPELLNWSTAKFQGYERLFVLSLGSGCPSTMGTQPIIYLFVLAGSKAPIKYGHPATSKD